MRTRRRRSGTRGPARPCSSSRGTRAGSLAWRFSPDGTRIVTGSYDKTAKVWDAQTGTPLLELKGHTGGCTSVAFSPDGTRIVTGSEDKTAKVWDAGTGTPLLELKGHTELGAGAWRFSPDGTRIVTGSRDRTAKVWDAQTGTPLLDSRGTRTRSTSVAFSPDGTRIVTGSEDKTAKVWDARTGTPLLDLKGHTGEVSSVRFSPDGTRIVTGSGDDDGEGLGRADRHAPARPQGAHGRGHERGVSPPTARGSSPAVGTGRRRSGTHAPARNSRADQPLDAEERDYRLFHTRPDYWRYAEGYDAVRQAKDAFAARFYLDRILSLPEHRTTARFQERNALQADPLVIARTGFHHPALAKTPYDRGTVALLAVHGDRLAQRLVAQELLREGKPGPAIPLLFWCLASRPATSPPVEELLLAQAYLDLKQPDEAKRFYQAATEWLDRPRDPKDGLGVGFAPNGTPAATRSTGKRGTSATCSGRRSNGGWRTNRESSSASPSSGRLFRTCLDRIPTTHAEQAASLLTGAGWRQEPGTRSISTNNSMKFAAFLPGRSRNGE